MEILFNSHREEYGFLSNFYPSPFTALYNLWPTVEHFFQAQKFRDPAIQDTIRLLPSPGEAAMAGRDRSLPLRSDWDQVKNVVMYQALVMKFSRNPKLALMLTKIPATTRLVEHTKRDSYWGDGGDGSGQNVLGILLMHLRDQLQWSIANENLAP